LLRNRAMESQVSEEKESNGPFWREAIGKRRCVEEGGGQRLRNP